MGDSRLKMRRGSLSSVVPLKFELSSGEKKIVVFLLSLLLIGATLSLVRSKVPWTKPSENVNH
jgi:hypothetical protein